MASKSSFKSMAIRICQANHRRIVRKERSKKGLPIDAPIPPLPEEQALLGGSRIIRTLSALTVVGGAVIFEVQRRRREREQRLEQMTQKLRTGIKEVNRKVEVFAEMVEEWNRNTGKLEELDSKLKELRRGHSLDRHIKR